MLMFVRQVVGEEEGEEVLDSCFRMASSLDPNALLLQLESSAQILLSPPNLVTSERRHEAEAVFMQFRKTPSPFHLCKHILGEKDAELIFNMGMLIFLVLLSSLFIVGTTLSTCHFCIALPLFSPLRDVQGGLRSVRVCRPHQGGPHP